MSYNADQTAAIVAGSYQDIKFVKIKEGPAANKVEIDLYEREYLEDV